MPEDAEDGKATGRQRASEHQAGCIDATAPFICDAKGEVAGVKTPAGSMATEQEIAADALEWSKSFACDARSCHAVNHDHDCTETCVKKAKKKMVHKRVCPRTWGASCVERQSRCADSVSLETS